MDTDLFLVIGIVLGILCIPSMLSAYTEGRAPRTASSMVLIAGGLITLAITEKTPPYSFAQIPDVFLRVFSRFNH